MNKEKIFVSKIDPTYSIKCWKGTVDIAYAFHVRSSSDDLFGDPKYDALPPMDCPTEIVDELRPLAFEFLGIEYINERNEQAS